MKLSHAFVINMPNSTERYRLFQLEAMRTKIPIERLDGVDGSPYVTPKDKPLTKGIIGCIKASCGAIQLAKERGYECVMIFDDDAQLCDDFDSKLEKAMSELPEDWVMLRLHKTTTGDPSKQYFSPNLVRVISGNGTYGYVVNSKYYIVILQYQEKNFRKPSKDDIGYIKTYDVILQEMMKEYPFYQTNENLVFHRDGYSDRMGGYMNFGLGRPEKVIERIGNGEKIKIYYPMHVAFHAERMAEDLNKLGYNAEATREVNSEDDSLYVLYCAFQINHLPKNYIVYQCEQWESGWMNEHYWGIMKGALAIWEFGENNISKYPDEMKDKVSFVPAGLVNGKTSRKDIDVLFYGALNNHRLSLINAVRSERIHVTYKAECYGEQMRDILSKSKVVLNIHFYENGHLEAFRINEALSCGCHVVSERNSTAFYPEKYKDLVSFGTNKAELVFAIKKALNSQFNKELSGLDNVEYLKEAMKELTLKV